MEPTQANPTEAQEHSADLSDLRIDELEVIVERGLATYQEVGHALRELRRRGDYKAEHGTWTNYLRQRWGCTRQRAHQLMHAAEEASTMVDAGLPAPANEREARAVRRPSSRPRATRGLKTHQQQVKVDAMTNVNTLVDEILRDWLSDPANLGALLDRLTEMRDKLKPQIAV